MLRVDERLDPVRSDVGRRRHPAAHSNQEASQRHLSAQLHALDETGDPGSARDGLEADVVGPEVRHAKVGEDRVLHHLTEQQLALHHGHHGDLALLDQVELVHFGADQLALDEDLAPAGLDGEVSLERALCKALLHIEASLGDASA